MSKWPFMQFMTGDYLKDPLVTLCEPSTRGIWVDLLLAMHELDRSGQITGTIDQLSRIGRCTAVQMSAAIEDLRTTKTADVTERNGVFTIVNRRMQRQHLERLEANNRKRKHRRKEDGTQKERESHNSLHNHNHNHISTHKEPSSSTGGSSGTAGLESVLACVELGREKLRIIYARQADDSWSFTEEKLFAELIQGTKFEEELRLIFAFWSNLTVADRRYFPNSLLGLFERWSETVDRAKLRNKKPLSPLMQDIENL